MSQSDKPREMETKEVRFTPIDQILPPVSTPAHQRGLANIGNTCYLNSAIQALRHIKPLYEHFRDGTWQQNRRLDRKGYEMTADFADLLCQLWGDANEVPERTLKPGAFVRSFLKYAQDCGLDDFRLGAQGDAAEAIQILLDGIHMYIAREVTMTISGVENPTAEGVEMMKALESWATYYRKEYSPIVQHLYGQTQTRLICTACNATSVRYEPWGTLKVPIPGADKAGNPIPSLQECIRAAFSTETPDDYRCDHCKEKGKVQIIPRISRFPKYLILSLKRFTNTGSKVHARIPYNPDHISFDEWVAWPSSAIASQYRVIACIEHMGSCTGGHYCMRARDTTGSEDAWMVYDDGTCYPSPVKGESGPDTYVLILEKLL